MPVTWDNDAGLEYGTAIRAHCVSPKIIKEINHQKFLNRITSMRIRSSFHSNARCCGSGMFIPDPNFSIPEPESQIPIKEFTYFNPKNCFKAHSNMIRIVQLGSGYWFVTHPGSRNPDPGVKRATDPGSASATPLMRIRIQLRFLPLLRIRILLHITLMRICDHWSTGHCERPGPSLALLRSSKAGLRIRIRINLSCWIRIRVYGGLGISKWQFLFKKIKIKFPAVNFFQF
jgi:hypothetical protein